MSKKISFEQLRALHSAYIWAEFLAVGLKDGHQGESLKKFEGVGR